MVTFAYIGDSKSHPRQGMKTKKLPPINSKERLEAQAILQRSADNACKLRNIELLGQCIRTFPELRIGQLIENLLSPDYTLYNIPDVILEQRMRQYLRDFGRTTLSSADR